MSRTVSRNTKYPRTKCRTRGLSMGAAAWRQSREIPLRCKTCAYWSKTARRKKRIMIWFVYIRTHINVCALQRTTITKNSYECWEILWILLNVNVQNIDGRGCWEYWWIGMSNFGECWWMWKYWWIWMWKMLLNVEYCEYSLNCEWFNYLNIKNID